jgi:hypothetical protein
MWNVPDVSKTNTSYSVEKTEMMEPNGRLRR